MSYGKKLYKSNLTAFDAENVYDSTIGKLQNEINANKVSKDGDTMIGTLNISLSASDAEQGINIINPTNGTSELPQSSVFKGIFFKDKDDVDLVSFYSALTANGTVRASMRARNVVNSTNVDNTLHLAVSASGARTVTVTDPIAWCNGIGALNIGTTGTQLASGTNVDTGLNDGEAYYSGSTNVTSTLNGTVPVSQGFKIVQVRSYSATNYRSQIAFTSSDATPIKIRHYIDANNVGTNTGWSPWWAPVRDIDMAEVYTATISDIVSQASGIDITAATYVSRGKVAQCYIQWKNTGAAVSVTQLDGNCTNMTVGTLVSGKRPRITIQPTSSGDQGGPAFYQVNSAGTITLCAVGSTGATRTIPTGTIFNLAMTYILP